MKILLDTQVLLWTQTGDARLNKTARKTIENSQNEVIVSVASIWEIGIKRALNKISIDFEALTNALKQSDIEILKIETEHAIAAADMPQIHRDPFDRMLIAQAMLEHAHLYTSDETLAAYGAHVHVI